MRILLNFDPKRTDVYSYLAEDDKNEYFILYREKKEVLISLPGFIKKEVFWNDYKNPDQIIDDLQISRIIFQNLIDIKQTSLNICAKARGIKTFFLDHGITTEASFSMEKHRNVNNKQMFRKVPLHFRDILKNRYFYYYSVKYIRFKSLFNFMRLPFYSSFFGFFKALHTMTFKERAPSECILFCRPNLSEVEYLYQVKEFSKVHYTGIPFFDLYHTKNDQQVVKKQLTYIDHPYFESSFFGWDANHHKSIALKLNECAIKNDLFIYVKLHPASSKNLWDSYDLDEKHIKVVQSGDYTNTYLSSELILGYSSTLLAGFICAKKNIVLLGWHPKPEVIGIDYSKTGLAHLSLTPQDLDNLLNYWMETNLCMLDHDAYSRFIDNYNCPFDGRAAKRIIDIIHS
ncbi:MAG TPA: hypothetical protein VNY73_01005 [Bacteroidia bacterium]|jgi:hypothetical protein|nr:hypothetical protein [Bacteroidia bacterium]